MHFNVMRLFEDSHNELWLFSKEQRGIVRYDPLANEQHYETPLHKICPRLNLEVVTSYSKIAGELYGLYLTQRVPKLL